MSNLYCLADRGTKLAIFLFLWVQISAQNSPEIIWDNYGVPHIYAKNKQGMFYAFGWAQMNNHANLLLRIYGQARGRAAEYWGAEYLASDKQVLLFDLPAKAETIYAKQPAAYKIYVDAFVKGVNDWAKTHTAAIDSEMSIVLPVTGADVFAHLERIIFRFLSANEREATERSFEAGSNAYAIGPSRSSSGNALLVMNPHLPWRPDFTTLFEAHLNAPGFNAYGTTMVGMPLLFLAFNNNLGWTFTTNTLDATDRYELTMQGDGYLLDSVVVPFKRKTKTIRIRQPGGETTEEKMEIKISTQGPVIGERNNKAYAMRIAGLDNDRVFEEFYRMVTANNFHEFEMALKTLQLPYFNIVYADKAKNIFYLFNGDVPKRPEGNFAYWRNTIDGGKSKLIWNETLPYEQLPKALNPPTGFLQNANDPPWNCTYPPVLDPKKYPAYVAPQNLGFRPQRAINMIRNDSSISFDELVGYKLNTGVETAERFLDDLFIAAEKYPDSAANKAVTILKAWDRKTDATSKGAVLFSAWFQKMTPAMYATRWDPNRPLTTPDGLKDEQQAIALLADAEKETEKKYGAADIAWGDAFRFLVNDIDLPATGGWPNQGIFMSVSYAEGKDKKYVATGGETFIAITEFGKQPKALVLLSYGNATQRGNKHIGDQLKLLSEKKLRPALLTRQDVLRNLESREILTMK